MIRSTQWVGMIAVAAAIIGCDSSEETDDSLDQAGTADDQEADASDSADPLAGIVDASEDSSSDSPDNASLGLEGNEVITGCTGSFPEGRMVLEHGRTISPAITNDRLELFYVQGEPTEERFYVTRRATPQDSFEPGELVTTLNSVCSEGQELSIDISGDGLRAYVACHDDIDTLAEFYVATRTERTDSFGEPLSLGTHAASFSVAYDELSAYGTLYYSGDATLFSSRDDLTATFGAPSPASGLESAPLIAPALSPDGLSLYGALDGKLQVATRDTLDSPFGTPVPIFGEGVVAGGPDMAGDCRHMVYVTYGGADENLRYMISETERPLD
ncbi:MAG: hypothetical protein MK135_10310 [Polyangiaceae bacterium]|nr:hypothetical protein [Polyangiaceae bacterium]